MEENENLNKRNANLENNLKELASISGVKGKKASKSEEDDMLVKAKELLFEKTKICKNQELQLEALNNQITATKEVLEITKDMLNLRNIESDHLHSRFESLELRAKNEKDRYLLTQKKLETSQQLEGDLQREFKIQQDIFKVSHSFYR